MTIKPGQAGRITAIAVSALKSTTSLRFQALKDFTLQTSSDGVTWTTAQKRGFTFRERRPTAPDLHLRIFKLAKPVQACCVRFFIDSVQGETQTRAEAAELQVFATSATTVTPSPPAPSSRSPTRARSPPATPPRETRPARRTSSASPARR